MKKQAKKKIKTLIKCYLLSFHTHKHKVGYLFWSQILMDYHHHHHRVTKKKKKQQTRFSIPW